jgi:hypothetical protein
MLQLPTGDAEELVLNPSRTGNRRATPHPATLARCRAATGAAATGSPVDRGARQDLADAGAGPYDLERVVIQTFGRTAQHGGASLTAPVIVE